MIVEPQDIQIYQTTQGKSPYIDWLEGLKDVSAQALITKRMDRVALGNLGDCKALQAGLYELRIHTGPGYRVY